MSELMNGKRQRESFRRNLLANASMLALLGHLGASQTALAASADEDPPTVWIELGGQFERANTANEIFAPPFVGKALTVDRNPMIAAQKPSPFSIGGEGKITFEPGGSDWVFSVGILYGRSASARHQHHQTPNPYVQQYFGTQIFQQPEDEQFGDGQTDFKESHAVLDFRAGKDVGLGMFGPDGKSVFSAGIRFAQFTSRSDVTLHARPEYKFGKAYSSRFYQSSGGYHRYLGYRTVNFYRHTYAATLQTRRNTRAFGPSISWEASLPVAGNSQSMTFAIDWGVNAAILFGRQRAQVHHHTTGQYHASVGRPFKYPSRHSINSSYAHGPFDHDRLRSVTIPNLGGFAGITFQKSITKISLGYRADFFFGAMDSGIDTAKRENIGFYGPFATVSIGLGG